MSNNNRAILIIAIVAGAVILVFATVLFTLSFAPTEERGDTASEQSQSPQPQEDSGDGTEDLPPEYYAVKAVEATLEGSEIPLGVAHPDYFDVTCELLYIDGLNVTETASVLEHDLIVTQNVFEPNFNYYMEYVAVTDVEWCQGIRGY